MANKGQTTLLCVKNSTQNMAKIAKITEKLRKLRKLRNITIVICTRPWCNLQLPGCNGVVSEKAYIVSLCPYHATHSSVACFLACRSLPFCCRVSACPCTLCPGNTHYLPATSLSFGFTPFGQSHRTPAPHVPARPGTSCHVVTSLHSFALLYMSCHLVVPSPFGPITRTRPGSFTSSVGKWRGDPPSPMLHHCRSALAQRP